MPNSLTIAHLLAPGGPLAGAEVLGGIDGLDNAVTWAVSLRPYAPAIPPLKGGEIALVGMDLLAKHEPPITLVEVVRQLATRGASGVAVRGDIDTMAAEEADGARLPLVQINSDTSLHELEQAVMRECALFQARREIMADEEPGAWVGRLLDGEITTLAEAQALARRAGYTLAPTCQIAYLHRMGGVEPLCAPAIIAMPAEQNQKREQTVIAHPIEGGLAVLLPSGQIDPLLKSVAGLNIACGVGRERPILEARVSLEEARLACVSSALLHNCEPMHYTALGAERMLLLLHRDRPGELRAFVEETLGPLLRHDAQSATKLLPTVASFVGHGGKLRETASDIYVHRNTLAYRLDRAAELLCADLKDADSRLAIEMALRALPLVQTDHVF